MKNSKIVITITIIGILLFILGCQEANLPPKQDTGSYETKIIDFNKEIKTKQFKSTDEFLNFVKKNSGRYYGGILMKGRAAISEMAVSESVPMAGGADSKKETTDFSGTNVQVEGVDEADIIKTDGNYIYTVSGNTLFIIKAYPGEEAEIVSKLKLENMPEGIFANENYLAVFGNYYNDAYFKKIGIRPRSGFTYMDIYLIEDKKNPELVKEYKFEGSYFRGRMKGSYMYMLTSMWPEYRVDMPTPIILDGTAKKSIPVEKIHYYDIPYNNPSFVNIHSINLEEPSESINSESIAVEGSLNLYMSEDNLFITYAEYVDEYEIQKKVLMDLVEPKLPDSDKELIEKIKKTDDDVLSRAEKEAKIFMVYESFVSSLKQEEQEEIQDEAEKLIKERLESYKYFEFTVINKVAVKEGDIKPVANGKVPGHIMNQFSLDENNGVLRIATTLSPRWSRYGSQQAKSTNNVYTLNSNLEVMDELEGLAEDESIFSTRFIGDRLYMVTFKQVDPFFVIDLNDPDNIKELGKLKIPGFSRYLHPYDKDTIIGIGKDATETGRQKGLKVSLFDVSDVENPKETASYISESRYSDSTALYEHKAFLFSKEKELLVIPAYNYNYEDKSENYNGALVFEIKKSSIELRGLIDHSSGKEAYWQPAVERSLYIEEMLYTKSANLLRINNIEDLSKVKSIELSYQDVSVPVY